MRSLRIHSEIFTGHMDYFPNLANFIVGFFFFFKLQEAVSFREFGEISLLKIIDTAFAR